MPNTNLAISEVETLLLQCRVWQPESLIGFFPKAQQPARAAEAFLRRLEMRGMMRSVVVDAVIVACPLKPIVTSRQMDFDVDAVSYQLKRRWSQPARRMRVYWPSERFSRQFGQWTGSDQLPCNHKIGHDLLVTAVTVAYATRLPTADDSWQWTCEKKIQFDSNRGCWSKPIPDALLFSNEMVTAIEIGGQYSAEWIRHHVGRFERAGWEWELW